MQAMASLAELLVWDCFPECVSCRFKVVTGWDWESDVKQPSSAEGRWDDRQTRGRVHCRHPCSPPSSMSSSSMVPNCVPRPRPGPLPNPPMWNQSGGWMCPASIETSREVPTCPPAPVTFSLSLQVLPPDLHFPSPSHKYTRSNSYDNPLSLNT